MKSTCSLCFQWGSSLVYACSILSTQRAKLFQKLTISLPAISFTSQQDTHYKIITFLSCFFVLVFFRIFFCCFLLFMCQKIRTLCRDEAFRLSDARVSAASGDRDDGRADLHICLPLNFNISTLQAAARVEGLALDALSPHPTRTPKPPPLPVHTGK